MADREATRKLAAILAADVVGYARLIRADEEGTLGRLKALRAELIHPKIAEHHGRVVKLMGDGMLAEFGSVVDAVRAAAETQRAVAERNAGLPEAQRIEFRIGINLGDVVIDGDDIQGDGVNVAARLEGLAEPGGICVSGAVHDQVRDRLDLAFEDMGDQEVKNLDRPLRVWRWLAQATARGPGEAPVLPDKPSIAVLAFENMSGDAEQEYFADGIAEDIITALSRFHWFFVIARNSSFAYKGSAANVSQVARELGVRYVLEGSVRRSGNRVRVTAQLVDAPTGHHVWAERYDREIADIFALQDEITEKIAGTVAPEFLAAEARRVERKPPESLDAWECLMRGNWYLWRFTLEGWAEAEIMFRKAIALDPRSVAAYASLAMTCAFDGLFNGSRTLDAAISESAKYAFKAVSLDETDPWARTSAGLANLLKRRPEAALASLRQAIERNPNLAMAHGFLGMTLSFEGDHGAAVPAIDTALRLSPRDPARGFWMRAYSADAFAAGRYRDAVDWTRKSIEASPGTPAGLATLAASLAHLGRMDEARACVEEGLLLTPNWNIAHMRAMPIKDPDYADRLVEGLRKAGLPE